MNELGKISQKLVAADQVSMIQVDEGVAGQRIDNFLLRVCKGVPKSHIYRILRSGEVRVNKGRVDAKYRLAAGDVVRVPPVRVAERGAGEPATFAPPARFEVLFEDEYLLAIDKPAGVAVHGGSGIAFGVIEQMREARPLGKFLELVHRLDRETSGVLMLAKKRAALVGLHEQIRENRIDKRYYACVHGQWAGDWGRRRAVKEPLFKYLTAEGERRVRVQPDGLSSHTVFNLVERWPDYALVEAELKTGRRGCEVWRLRAQQGACAGRGTPRAQADVPACAPVGLDAPHHARTIDFRGPLARRLPTFSRSTERRARRGATRWPDGNLT
jgi:23S rRNA pseudouridine955/2504/2580 synthase